MKNFFLDQRYLFTLLIPIILLTSSVGNACDCILNIGLKEAKSVFKGEVISIKMVEQPYIFYEIEFNVYKYIKGKKKRCNKVVKISVPSLEEGGCGIPFEIGSQYIVFTYIEDEMEYTSICTNTKKIHK